METLERVRTARGELALRRDGDRYEIISNGVFLMDTSDGTSERLLVDAAVGRCGSEAPGMLIGGLGVGFSLRQAVTHAHLAAIDVIEIEPAIIGWHGEHFAGITGDAVADPRVRLVEGDAVTWLAGAAGRYDIVCLDTDNGPNWLVFDSNAGLYDEAGLEAAHASLRPGGVLAVWSAAPDEDFARRLESRFGSVETHEIAHPRGAPDLVYLATAT